MWGHMDLSVTEPQPIMDNWLEMKKLLKLLIALLLPDLTLDLQNIIFRASGISTGIIITMPLIQLLLPVLHT